MPMNAFETANAFKEVVPVADRTYHLKKYKSVFIGSEAVDYLVARGIARSRRHAVRIGQHLMMDLGLFSHVKDGAHGFRDEHLFYRYTDEATYAGSARSENDTIDSDVLGPRGTINIRAGAIPPPFMSANSPTERFASPKPSVNSSFKHASRTNTSAGIGALPFPQTNSSPGKSFASSFRPELQQETPRQTLQVQSTIAHTETITNNNGTKRSNRLAGVKQVEGGLLLLWDDAKNMVDPEEEQKQQEDLAVIERPYILDLDPPFESKIKPEEMRCLGLVAHNHMKPAMKQFVLDNKNLLRKFRLTGTGTTMKMLSKVFGEEHMKRFGGPVCKSGPLGGDAELVAQMCSENLGAMFFFQDPMDAHPHSADIECLNRQANVHNVMVCANPTSAHAMTFVLREALKIGEPSMIPSFFFTLESPSVREYKLRQAAVLEKHGST